MQGHLRDMALPMVVGLIATMSFNAVDTFFVSKLGCAPLAAMSFTFPVVMIVTSMAIGLGAGASSAVAREIGAGNLECARRIVTDAMSLTGLLSALLCALGAAIYVSPFSSVRCRRISVAFDQ